MLEGLKRKKKVSNTTLKCKYCGRESSVDFGYCLRHGWPVCCNYTMTMKSSTANIPEVAKETMGPQLNMEKMLEKKA
jgi:hypothetical protein